jgi:hypothetical protein
MFLEPMFEPKMVDESYEYKLGRFAHLAMYDFMKGHDSLPIKAKGKTPILKKMHKVFFESIFYEYITNKFDILIFEEWENRKFLQIN